VIHDRRAERLFARRSAPNRWRRDDPVLATMAFEVSCTLAMKYE
jgi:hypothetical protein